MSAQKKTVRLCVGTELIHVFAILRKGEGGKKHSYFSRFLTPFFFSLTLETESKEQLSVQREKSDVTEMKKKKHRTRKST